MSDTKWCPKCERDRSISEFYVNVGRHDGLSPRCVDCHHDDSADYQRRLRAETLALLGDACQWCGFADARALQIDHVHGRKGQKRLAGKALLEDVRQQVNDYQLLCANCNQIKKHDENETVGDRNYDRQIPTQKLQGIGAGNAPGQREALARARTPEHQAAAGRANKGKLNPKVAESRRGTKKGYREDGSSYWYRPEGV